MVLVLIPLKERDLVIKNVLNYVLKVMQVIDGCHSVFILFR